MNFHKFLRPATACVALISVMSLMCSCGDDTKEDEDVLIQTIVERPVVDENHLFFIDDYSFSTCVVPAKTQFSKDEIEELLASKKWDVSLHRSHSMCYDDKYVVFGQMVKPTKIDEDDIILADLSPYNFVTFNHPELVNNIDWDNCSVDYLERVRTDWRAEVDGNVLTISEPVINVEKREVTYETFLRTTIVGYRTMGTGINRFYLDTSVPENWILPSKMDRNKALRRLYITHWVDE